MVKKLIKVTGALALCMASSVFAQSDREIYELTASRSAEICPGYSKDRTVPVLQQVPVGALRVLLKRRFVMCPDRRLDADAPAVWYGSAGVFTWNPEVKGAEKIITEKVDAMTRSEEFPVETLVWDIKGNTLKNRTVPTFEVRPRAPL